MILSWISYTLVVLGIILRDCKIIAVGLIIMLLALIKENKKEMYQQNDSASVPCQRLNFPRAEILQGEYPSCTIISCKKGFTVDSQINVCKRSTGTLDRGIRLFPGDILVNSRNGISVKVQSDVKNQRVFNITGDPDSDIDLIDLAEVMDHATRQTPGASFDDVTKIKYIILSKEGNMYVYNVFDKVIYSSRTHGLGINKLEILGNGEIGLLKDDLVMWKSGQRLMPPVHKEYYYI